MGEGDAVVALLPCILLDCICTYVFEPHKTSIAQHTSARLTAWNKISGRHSSQKGCTFMNTRASAMVVPHQKKHPAQILMKGVGGGRA